MTHAPAAPARNTKGVAENERKISMTEHNTIEVRKEYAQAEKRVEEKIGFFRHLIIYVVTNALLIAFNMIISSDFFWFLLPLGLWGIGILAHFVIVFVFSGERLERWRKREIGKEIDKLKGED
ncbi:2TM domain-containing protein [Chloroflexota bacterium]